MCCATRYSEQARLLEQKLAKKQSKGRTPDDEVSSTLLLLDELVEGQGLQSSCRPHCTVPGLAIAGFAPVTASTVQYSLLVF